MFDSMQLIVNAKAIISFKHLTSSFITYFCTNAVYGKLAQIQNKIAFKTLMQFFKFYHTNDVVLFCMALWFSFHAEKHDKSKRPKY